VLPRQADPAAHRRVRESGRRSRSRDGRLLLRDRRGRLLHDRHRHLGRRGRRHANATAGWLDRRARCDRSLTGGATDVTDQDFGLFTAAASRAPCSKTTARARHRRQRRPRRRRGRVIGAAVRTEASGCAGICDSDVSTTGGAFVLWIPFAANGQSVAVIETNAPASSRRRVCGHQRRELRPRDRHRDVPRRGRQRLHIPRVRGRIRQQLRAEPPARRDAGTAVFHPHVFSAGAGGTVRFAAANVASPAVAGWAQSLFHDTNCSGTLDAAEPQLQPSDAIAVAAAGSSASCCASRCRPGAGWRARPRHRDATFSSAGGAGASSPSPTSRPSACRAASCSKERRQVERRAGRGAGLHHRVSKRRRRADHAAVIADATPKYTTFVPASASAARCAQLGSCTPAPPPSSTARSRGPSRARSIRARAER